MRDRAGDATPKDNPTVRFGGDYNHYNGLGQFLLQRDTDGVFRVVSLQSEVGEASPADHGHPPTNSSRSRRSRARTAA